MSDVTGTTYNLADEALEGLGCELKVGDGASPETFQAIKGVKSIEPGDSTTTDQDTTHLRSANRHKEHRAGIRDSGPWQITAIYLPEDESQSYAGGGSGSFTGGGIAKLSETGENRNFRLTLTDSSPTQSIAFRGYVGNFKVGTIAPDASEPIMCTFTVQPVEAVDLP